MAAANGSSRNDPNDIFLNKPWQSLIRSTPDRFHIYVLLDNLLTFAIFFLSSGSMRAIK